MNPNPNELQARIRELDRLRRAHIRGLQLAARAIKAVVHEAAQAGIRPRTQRRPEGGAMAGDGPHGGNTLPKRNAHSEAQSALPAHGRK